MSTSLRSKLGKVKWELIETYRKLAYRLAVPWNHDFTRDFWDSQADMIHERYGTLEHDFQVLGRLLSVHKPTSLIDVGCGSGRLFELYKQHHVQDVVGIDISVRALAIANKRFPEMVTMPGSLLDLDFPRNRFDMAICNRVLQHIPARLIAASIAQLCKWCSFIYVNELADTDDLNENFYMIRHQYGTLFSAHGFRLLEKGSLHAQTYQVFGR